MSAAWDAFQARAAEFVSRNPISDGTINAATLRGLQGRASMLAAQPPGSERAADDAHDLLNTVIGILEDNGVSLITDPDDVELAFTMSHV